MLAFLRQPSLVSAKEIRQENLLLKFELISIFFAIGYFLLSFFNGFLMARYAMVVAILLFSFKLLGYQQGWISLRVCSHIYIFICWLIVVVLSLASDGIHSFVLPWVTLMPVLGLVMLSGRVAWLWSAIGSMTVVAMMFIEPRDFISNNLLMTGNNLLTASLHIGLQFLVFTLTYIFDSQQNELVQTVEQQNLELRISQEAIATQNKQLLQSQEEILSQRDTVAKQNQNLLEARKTIDIQHEALLEKNETLEVEIQKRTKELVDYNHQLEQFAFISSHNLRTPIARILGLGSLLELSNSKEDEMSIQRNLVESAHELDRIVKDLNIILEVRKSANQVVSEINVREEIDMILINLEKDISDTRTQIEVDVRHIPSIRTVRPYFDSIVINLISNAIKYRKPNVSPIILLKGEWKKGIACFSVTDNGMGIDLERHRQKLFTLYSRFHDHIEGKGLGLYMIKTQVEALGGSIEVESQLDVGTTFRFYIKPS
ncbi:MAG: sensor histidine kinase [Cytophagales bacterium]